MGIPENSSLKDFVLARPWVSEHGGYVFPSYDSFAWFIRKHREELIQSGQYLPRKGSAGALIGPHFAELAFQIISRECRAGEVHNDAA